MKEVDFILSEEDIRSLRQNDLSRIYIKHSDGSCTLEFFVKFSQNRFFEQKEEGDKNAFKRFIKLYYKALKEAEVINAKTKMTRFENTRIQQLASALGINESQAIELFKTHLSSEHVVEVNYDYCYVYLMCDKRNGYYKIGISKEPKYREKTLQSEQPAIEMVCNKRYPSPKIAKAIEFALHEAYSK